MFTLLNELYYRFRKEEIEKARIIFKRIKIDTILQSLTKLCWKYNIQYEVIMKTSDLLTIKFNGNRDTIVFKYHKIDMVLRDDIDFFMSELNDNKADKGFYLTTGEFEKLPVFRGKDIACKRDCILEDSSIFVRRHLGIKGKAYSKFKVDNLNFFKYLPH